METVFKIGDKVFDYNYGWGEVVKFVDFGFFIVKFKDRNVGYDPNGGRPNSNVPILSFTEYTLQGFSQERPIDYNDYIGKWGKFWRDDADEYRLISKLRRFDGKVFQTDNGTWFPNFKPLTEEQIKILDL